MNSQTVISVITPSYNQGCYLAETIESVLTQEGDFCLDYIIVDGGSTDESVEIIKRYERLMREGAWKLKCGGVNYRWISEEDKGQTDALIKGFRMAEGEILAWLNSDDVYLPGALQLAAVFFRENPMTALLYGDTHYFDADGNIIGKYPAENFDLVKLARFNFICQPSTFFRREAFSTVGGLDGSLNYAMDYDLFVRICKQFDCFYLPQFLSKYRLHEVSKTVRDDVLFDNHEEILRIALKYFDWAPLNVVYGSSYYFCRSRLPQYLRKFRPLVLGAALVFTVFRSLWLNRGLRREDLKLLKMANLRKIFKDRMEILTG